jgi:hypothetical protein
MDLWVLKAVEKHQRDNGHRASFRYFAGFIEGDFLRHHSAQVDPFSEPKGSRLGAETRQSVNSFMAETTISIARRVVENE